MLSERELENYLWQHPEVISPTLQLVGRQVTVEHGIIDLLGWDKGVVYVIELKVNQLDHHDLAQVLRYTQDIHGALDTICTAWWPTIDDPEPYAQAWFNWFDTNLDGPRAITYPIRPMLIGSSTTWEMVAAAHGAKCEIRLWNAKTEVTVGRIKPKDRLSYGWESSGWPEWLVGLGALVDDYCRESTADDEPERAVE